MESGDRQAGRQHIDGQKVGRQASENGDGLKDRWSQTKDMQTAESQDGERDDPWVTREDRHMKSEN